VTFSIRLRISECNGPRPGRGRDPKNLLDRDRVQDIRFNRIFGFIRIFGFNEYSGENDYSAECYAQNEYSV
jgi:hypothetical protein